MTSPVDTTLPAPRTGWRRVLRWIRNGILAILMVVGLWVVQRLYFIATPEAPTPERLVLDERTQAGNVDSDGGLLFMGLLAPADMDPVAYGRCLLEAERSAWNDAGMGKPIEPGTEDEIEEASEARYSQWQATRDERVTACASGNELLTGPTSDTHPRPRIDWTDSQWHKAAEAPVDAHLSLRFDQIMDSASRSIRVYGITDELPGFSVLAGIHRSKTAKLRAMWRYGERRAAESAWLHAVESWPAFANQNLISAMIGVAAQTDHLLAIHSLASDRAVAASAEDWSALMALTEPAEDMAQAIVPALENERLFYASIQGDMLNSMSLETGWPKTTIRAVFDQAATSNLHADMVLRAATNAQKAAMGDTSIAEEQAAERSCAGFPVVSRQNMPLCALLGRNGVGVVLMAIAEPAFASYGTRIADLRNLAAATRLTLEARRQGIAPGAVTAEWVRQAPADMRDVFTHEPFEYDADRKVLRILLRERNTALGNAQTTYALPI